MPKIPELVRRRLGKDEQILRMLRERTKEFDALAARINGETNERLGYLARHQAVAHFKKLKEDRRAVTVEPAGAYRAI